MKISIEHLSKRNLSTLLYMIDNENNKLTHQRGRCNEKLCKSCLHKPLCEFLCEFGDLIEKELEKFEKSS